MFTFGPLPAYHTGPEFDPGVSPDKRAITLTFSDFKVESEFGKGPLILSQLFTIAIPIEGSGDKREAEIALDGFALTHGGASATLMASLNGQSIIEDFPPNSDASFTKKLTLPANSGPECRLCVLLLLSRLSDSDASAGSLGISAIEVEMLPHAT